MKNTPIIAIGCLLLSTSWSHAQAGQDRGGGRGIVCRDSNNKIKSISLLDYFEAQNAMSLTIDLGPQNSYQEKLQFVLNRLEQTDQVFAKKIKSEVSDFMQSTTFVEDVDLEVVNDSTSSVKPPKGCSEEQMGVNKVNPLPFQKNYLIRRSLWESADASTKAGLILHEVIYRYARKIGEATSDHARYYNALISSSNMKNLSTAQYTQALQQIGWLKGIGYTDGGCSSDFSVFVNAVPYFLGCDLTVYNDHSVYRGAPVGPQVFQSPIGPLKVGDHQFVGFNPSNILVVGSLASETILPLGAQMISLPAGTSFFFNENGRIKQVQLGGGLHLSLSHASGNKVVSLDKYDILYVCGDGDLSLSESNCDRR